LGAAILNDELPPNPFEVHLPATSAHCDAVTVPIVTAINSLVQDFIEVQNCLIFAEGYFCGNLKTNGVDTCSSIYQTLLDDRNFWIADSIIPTLQSVDPSLTEASLFQDFGTAIIDGDYVIVPQADSCGFLPATIPAVCSAEVSFDATNALRSDLETRDNFHAYLEQRQQDLL
jgi:hypothetical protein